MSRKRRVFKVPYGMTPRYASDWQFHVFVGILTEEQVPVGRCAISLKKGCKRKLVSGMMSVEDYELCSGKRELQYFFEPSSEKGLKKLKELLE